MRKQRVLLTLLAVSFTTALFASGATVELQEQGNALLSLISGNTPTTGQATMANSQPVVIASDQSTFPVTAAVGAVTATTAFDRGPGGAFVDTTPAKDTTTPANNIGMPILMLAGDGLGTLSVGAGATSALTLRTILATDQATLPISAASLPLPAGASTSALQTTGNTSLSSIDGKLNSLGQKTMATSVPVVVSSDQSVLPVSAASLPLPAGASTSALQTTGNTSLSNIDGKLNSLGQKAMAASAPVVISSDQSTLSTTNTSIGSTGFSVPTDATLIGGYDGGGDLVSVRINGSGALTTDASGTTSPVSVASLPLPTGASTSALQTTGNTSLSSIDGKLNSLGQKAMVASVPVVVSSDQSTLPVSAASLPLPTGASTSALQTTGNTSLSSIDGKLNSLGQKAMAASAPVVISSDQSAILVDGSAVTQPVSAAALPLPTGASTSALQTTGNTSTTSIDGKLANDHGSSAGAIRVTEANNSFATSVRNDYTSINVTTGAWVQLIASTAANIHHLYIFDSCGETLELGTGAAASETRVFIIPPGGWPSVVDLTIASGTRVAIRAISATCSTGEIDITGIN